MTEAPVLTELPQTNGAAAPKKPAAPKAPKPQAQPTPAARRPCVGLWVQLCVGPTERDVIPALLQRESRTEAGVWFLKTVPEGAVGFATRSDVRQSDAPRVGCFNLLPE